jgi:hypothetical protein
MSVDSKTVAKALKADVFPVLREAGFSEFKSRTAWRSDTSTIAVLDFPSLGSYLGSAVGVTSHSFGAVTGVYYRAMHATPWAKEPLPALPEEWRCQARRVLRKSMFQFRCWRPDVWYVNRKGSNLDSVVADTVRAVREQALPWLSDMADLPRALEAFESRPESEMRPGIMRETLGGVRDSFARADAASALALACGRDDRARAAWERMLGNPYYKGPSEMRALAEERIRLIEDGRRRSSGSG